MVNPLVGKVNFFPTIILRFISSEKAAKTFNSLGPFFVSVYFRRMVSSVSGIKEENNDTKRNKIKFKKNICKEKSNRKFEMNKKWNCKWRRCFFDFYIR